MQLGKSLFLAIFTLLGTPSLAADVTLAPGYLDGKWTSGDKESCGSSAAQYALFRGNGVLEVGRGATPGAVGFWGTKGDTITVHLLVAPNESDTSNAFYRGRYNYSYLAAKVLETRQDAFDMISETTGNMVTRTWTKCD